MDTFQGIITGAVIERAGPTGNILMLHEGTRASVDAIQKMNILPIARNSIVTLPVDVFYTKAHQFSIEERQATKTEPVTEKHDPLNVWSNHKVHSLVSPREE